MDEGKGGERTIHAMSELTSLPNTPEPCQIEYGHPLLLFYPHALWSDIGFTAIVLGSITSSNIRIIVLGKQ